MISKRDNLEFLKNWRTDPIRVPLLIRGARQVGKSWLARQFGKEFHSYIEVNFEKDKRVHSLFPSHISLEKTLEQLQIYTHKKLSPTKLFYSWMKSRNVQMTSALEFLIANERDDLRHHIQSENIDAAIHEIILDYLKNYMWLGGMPAVIDTWLTHKDSSLCQRVQDRIIKTYIDDFQKYAKAHQVEHVGHVFSSIPKQLGKKFKYTSVDPDAKTYPIKQALHLLDTAGITYQCFHTAAQAYPLAAEVDIKKFKVFFFDIGIAHRVLGLNLAEWVSNT